MKYFTIIILLFSCTSLSAQTKQETYDYIKDKLKYIALQNSSIEHGYSIREIGGNSQKKQILIVDATNIYSPDAQSFEPASFKSITISEKSSSLWFNINCIDNSVASIGKNAKGEFEVYDMTSSTTIILNKGTQKEDIERLKKAFLHLLKLYGVEKRDLFD